MQKVKWRKQTLTIAAGSNFDQKNINIPSGLRVVAAATASKTKNQIIDLGILENGSEIEASMDLNFWKKTEAGKFLDGFKPLEYKGGSTITVEVKAATNVDEDLQIQVVFGIIENDASC